MAIPNPNKNLKDRRLLSLFYDAIIKQVNDLMAGVAGVSSVNGLSGAVTLDADNIDPTAARQYLSASQASAITANTAKVSYTDAATVADHETRIDALEDDVTTLLNPLTDDVADTPVAGQTTSYIGWSETNVATSASSWRIKRLVTDDNTQEIIDSGFADDVRTFTKVWDDRATYAY